jgi:hypothetical protein
LHKGIFRRRLSKHLLITQKLINQLIYQHMFISLERDGLSWSQPYRCGTTKSKGGVTNEEVDKSC